MQSEPNRHLIRLRNVLVNQHVPEAGLETEAPSRELEACRQTNCDQVESNNGVIITGALYFPKQHLDYNSNNTVSTCTQLIADQLEFSSNVELKANCANLGTTAIGSTFDIHFRVIELASGAVVLESACYQFVVTQ